MKVTKLKPFVRFEDDDPQDPINPFHHDAYHMGTRMGSNLFAMHKNFSKDECPYLILVNTKTGERLRIDMNDSPSHT